MRACNGNDGPFSICRVSNEMIFDSTTIRFICLFRIVMLMFIGCVTSDADLASPICLKAPATLCADFVSLSLSFFLSFQIIPESFVTRYIRITIGVFCRLFLFELLLLFSHFRANCTQNRGSM